MYFKDYFDFHFSSFNVIFEMTWNCFLVSVGICSHLVWRRSYFCNMSRFLLDDVKVVSVKRDPELGKSVMRIDAFVFCVQSHDFHVSLQNVLCTVWIKIPQLNSSRWISAKTTVCLKVLLTLYNNWIEAWWLVKYFLTSTIGICQL